MARNRNQRKKPTRAAQRQTVEVPLESTTSKRKFWATIVVLTICLLFAAVMVVVIAVMLSLDKTRTLFSGDTEPVSFHVGGILLKVPKNFLSQSDDASDSNRPDLPFQFHWPTGSGFNPRLREEFHTAGYFSNIIRAEVSTRKQTDKLSVRRKLEIIHRRFFDRETTDAPSGLIGWHYKADSPYSDVVSYYERGYAADAASPFFIRCILSPSGQSNQRSCIREISLPHNLVLVYRFSHALLKEWREIDAKVKEFVLRFSSGTLDPDSVPVEK